MAKRAQGITAITVGGYKSIRDETTIKIRPLTILAGANSSGKSSIMQPMLLMKQTLDSSYDPGQLLLDGPHVKFTKYEQLLPRTGGKNCPILTAGYTFGRNSRLLCKFNFSSEDGALQRRIELSRMRVETRRLGIYELTPGMSQAEIIPLLPELFQKRMNESDPDREYERRFGWRTRTSRCFLHIERFRKRTREICFSLPQFIIRSRT